MKIISTYIFCLLTTLLFSQDTTYICHHEEIGVFPLENLNSKSIEFSPAYYQSGLVYVVAREKNRFIDPKTGRAYFDLMYSDLGPDGETSKSVSFSPNIRTQYHEGPCTFNGDGTELFFTRSNLSGGLGINDDEGQVQLKIYRATKGPEDWEEITPLPFCSDAYSVAHPTLSPDGHYLVFASDMPGGYGGMDLYVVDRTIGPWSTPVNLGETINTKGHELFPFWHADGYLLFSSDGHEGKGGLDLFVSRWNTNGTFTGIQHLNTPFNSSRDDLGMIIAADGRSGYLASDRKPTKGKDDLYRWISPQSIFCVPSVPPEDMMIGREIMVVDENGNPVDQTYVWMIPMGKEGPSLHKEHFNTELVPKNDKEGAFFLRWGVTDTLSTETADAISNPEGKVDLTSDPKSGHIIVAQHNGYEPYVEVLDPEQIPAIIRLKKMHETTAPCLNTLFTVYNTTGDIELNGAKIQLSGNCLKSPLVFYTDEDGNGKRCLPKGCTLKAEIEQEGYSQHAFSFTPADEDEHWKIYLKSSDKLTSPTAPIASGTVIVLDNIYYDFNKSAIRKGDAGELIALAKILKQYPDLTIELTSHTDTRGSAEYNMELSEKRSESSKSYLVLLGIDASRIITKAAGESSPRNKCLDDVPCTEAEHQFNRRTEVRITNPAQGMEIKYKAEG
jgi:outer membrane protein OmpA-like peptidoglycan-associated protein